MSERLNHVDRCLKKAGEAEQAGDKEKAQYWLNMAERYEKSIADIKHLNAEHERNKNQRGGFNV